MRTGPLFTALAACCALLSAGSTYGQGSTCATAAVIAAPGTYAADGPSAGGGALPACTNDDGTAAIPASNADWYSYTAPSSGVLIVGCITTGIDSRLSIYTGTCGSLVCVGGDDDINATVATSWETNNYRSRVAIPVVSGTTYLIQWDNTWSTTAFEWNLSFSESPAVGTTVSAFPYTEEFDGLATCLPAGTNTPCNSVCASLGSGWTNNTGDQGDVYLRSGATGTPDTGPDFGVSGNPTTDKYIYLESSLTVPVTPPTVGCRTPYQVAVLTSPSYNTSAFTREPQVRFYDHMYGVLTPAEIGTLTAQYELISGSGNWVTFFSKTGSQGNQWNTNPYTTLPLGTPSFRVRWIFIRGNFFQSDLAIDRVEVRERPDCTSPVATASVIEDCQPTAAASTFTVNVNVTDFGTLSGGAQTQCTIVPSSGAPQVATALGNYVFGPYAFGTVVTFSLTHQSEPACNSTIPGSYFSCCGSTCATAFTPAIGVNANTNAAYTTCAGGATNAYDSGNPAPTAARWWAFTPAASGVYNISSCGQAPNTNNDTRVSVHTGTCGGLSLYTADDDGCSAPVTFDSYVDAYLVSGTTYYIEWDNAWGVNTAHTWSLTGPVAPILGDVCTDAIPLTMAPTCSNTLVSSAGATAETPSCAAGVGATTNADVWMSFVATDDLCQIDVTPVGVYYPVLELLEGTCAGLNSLCCTFNGSGPGLQLTLLRGGLTIGATYYLRVGHAFGGGDGGTNEFNICVTEGVAPTPGCTFSGTPDYTESEPCGTLTNSDLCTAEPIVLGSLPFTFTIGGTIQAECNFRDRDFYIFTLPTVGTYQVDFTAQFASRIFFLDANGLCSDPLVQINTAGALACATGTITQSLAPGTYALMMTTDGIFNNLTCGTLNDYQMTITAVPDLDCGLAVPIACGDPYGVALSGPGLWSVTSCGFLTPGNEAIYLLDATTAGTYNLSVTNANGQYVDYFFKPTSGGCTPGGWTCIQDIASVTSVDFNIATPGQYWLLADAEDDAVTSTQTFRVFCPTVTSSDYCAPVPLVCGTSAQGQTSPIAGTFPPTACPYPVAPSTAGVNYWSYTAAADGEVALSVCGAATFDTRISVYLLSPDCDNLECIAKNDDGTGCPNFSSELAFPVTNGSQYLVAVHGYGGDYGFYSMSVQCGPSCVPATVNDRCSQAQVLSPVIDDGNGVPVPGDNTCAYGDENTGCDPFGAMQGVWYAFNSGPNSIMFMDLIMGTASGMNYALYDGGCTGLGAANEIACALDADGPGTALPALTPNTDYLLYLWNNGGLSNEGDFDILLRHPGMNDAAIDTILEPEGELCSTGLVPRVVLRNAGENDLTSVTITYQVTGGGPAQNYAWTGDLAYQETDTIYLSTIVTVPGTQTLTVTAQDPNNEVDDLPANDQATKQVTITGQAAKLLIATDNNGDQLTWVITDAFGFTVAQGGPYTGQNNALIQNDVCLPTTFGTCYSLYLFDSGGDGLCCLNGNGYWELRTENNRLLLRDLFNSTPSGALSPPNTQPLGHEFCLPAGPSNILPGECGIFTNQLLNKVYTSTVPGVLNYQFEFTDPDAGFRRRIAVSRPWVAFSEMQTSPLTPGVVYFCRARADQGASGFTDDNFGSGCEMGLDPNNVPGCTQLIDNPSLSTHSCGVTKPFGGSAKIWAVPVVGATQYRFNFNNPGEGYNRNVLRSSYVCPLNWVTQPLVNGSTYNVKVEVFANGVWGGFCGATCSVTILNPGMMLEQTAGTTVRLGQEPAAGISLYPNPVRDGRVQLRIEGMTDSEQAIAVDVFDIYGKRVMTQQFRNGGDVFNTVLMLDGSMASGVYVVNITVNGQVTTKRLSVM